VALRCEAQLHQLHKNGSSFVTVYLFVFYGELECDFAISQSKQSICHIFLNHYICFVYILAKLFQQAICSRPLFTLFFIFLW